MSEAQANNQDQNGRPSPVSSNSNNGDHTSSPDVVEANGNQDSNDHPSPITADGHNGNPAPSPDILEDIGYGDEFERRFRETESLDPSAQKLFLRDYYHWKHQRANPCFQPLVKFSHWHSGRSCQGCLDESASDLFEGKPNEMTFSQSLDRFRATL